MSSQFNRQNDGEEGFSYPGFFQIWLVFLASNAPKGMGRLSSFYGYAENSGPLIQQVYAMEEAVKFFVKKVEEKPFEILHIADKKVVQALIPPCAYFVKKYNYVVQYLCDGNYRVAACLHIVPVEKIESTIFRELARKEDQLTQESEDKVAISHSD